MNRAGSIEYPVAFAALGTVPVAIGLSGVGNPVRRRGKILAVHADKTAGPATQVNVRIVDTNLAKVLFEVLNEPFPLRWNPVPIPYADILDEANMECECWTDDGTNSTNVDVLVTLEHP